MTTSLCGLIPAAFILEYSSSTAFMLIEGWPSAACASTITSSAPTVPVAWPNGLHISKAALAVAIAASNLPVLLCAMPMVAVASASPTLFPTSLYIPKASSAPFRASSSVANELPLAVFICNLAVRISISAMSDFSPDSLTMAKDDDAALSASRAEPFPERPATMATRTSACNDLFEIFFERGQASREAVTLSSNFPAAFRTAVFMTSIEMMPGVKSCALKLESSASMISLASFNFPASIAALISVFAASDVAALSPPFFKAASASLAFSFACSDLPA
mmetsp:Transcript_50212/g.94064  ORF Transcript_50212/g.94064 Transcript_50212/m.94064 type:complete len:278 (+) Transcript_50212:809-1642(+)